MAETPYREPSPPVPEPPDREHLAIATMGKRVKLVRSIVVVGGFFAGIVSTAMLFSFFQNYYEEHHRVMPIKMAIVASFVLAMVPSLWIAPRLATLTIRVCRAKWLDSISKKHDVSREELDEMTAAFR